MAVLCILCPLLAAGGLVTSAHAQPQSVSFVAPPHGDMLPLSTPKAASNPTVYDEQLGTTFSQSFTAIAYNVTAVEQQDPTTGYGPAYLLNGLTGQDYWYQVGLSWNWCGPVTDVCTGYIAGFNMNYEVFNTRQQSIFPTGGGGGIANYSGAINPGDTVTLSLSFSGGTVVMSSTDLNTRATASVSFSAEGSSSFIGITGSTSNSNGYFTGLMTEWYHPAAYTGNEQEVVYTESAFSLTQAVMWMDEYNVNNANQVIFNVAQAFTYSSSPAQLQEFASDGATEYGDATTFITGELPAAQVPLTLSYSVQGGGSGYSPPVLTYVSGGMTETATLGTTPMIYELDSGSSWSVNPTLAGSGSTERWETSQTTSGAATSSQTINLVYDNQYLVNFAVSPSGAGTTTPSGSGQWEDAGALSISATSASDLVFSTWSSNTAAITFAAPASPSTTATISGTGTITANFATPVTVTEQVSIAMSPKGSAPVAVAISGCDASVQSIEADGNAHGFTAYSSCTLTFTAPAETASNLWEFSSSGTGSLTWTHTTGSSGTSVESSTLFALDRETVSFSVSGGGSGYSPPSLSFQELGAPQTYTATAQGAEVDLDNGTSWSLTNPLTGSSSSERWQAPPSDVSGTSVGGATIAPVYYDQYQPAIGFSVSDGGTGYSSPSFTCLRFGAQLTVDVSTTATGDWVDSGCSYAFTNPLAGSGSTERWQASSASGMVSSAGTLSPTYYNQFAQTLSYSISGGGSPNAPSASGLQFGSSHAIQLTTSPTKYWFDATGSLSFSSILPGATNERWATPTISLPANSSSANTVAYFQEYQNSFAYAISGGGSPSQAPTLACSQGGNADTLPLSTSPETYWCDSGAEAKATDPAPGSTTTERWSDDGQSFQVSGGGATDNFTYYHQFLITIGYSVLGGGSPSSPSFDGTLFGKTVDETFSASGSTIWLDSGSSLNISTLLQSGASQRWVEVSNVTFPVKITSAVTEAIAYQHQYYVTLTVASTGGGVVTQAEEPTSNQVAQWDDANSTVSIQASAQTGWSLGTWEGVGQGSYSGSSNPADISAMGPINETAVFYPSLELDVESGGSVSYSYGSTTGQVSAGQHMVYVPPNTTITLTASPASIFYSFAGWTVAHTSSASTTHILVSSPTITEASFSYNLVLIAGLLGAVIVVVAVAIYAVTRSHHS